MFGSKRALPYFVALDLGQTRDYSALAVIERVETRGEWDALKLAHRLDVELRLRHLERIPLGTAYMDVVARTREVVRSARLSGACRLMVDASGVGRPVMDMIHRGGMGCTVYPVTITAGYRESYHEGYYHVPKRDLITGLQARLQSGSLKLAANMRYGPTLVKELAEMRVKVTASGNEQFAACGREGAHDDLVLAVALACWGVGYVYPEGWERWWMGPRAG
jgi:hypothetical protein